MTRDYNKGKIYKLEPIVEHEENDIYIGSTTKQYPSQRMATHKGDYYDYTKWKNNKRGKVMIFDIFDKYGFENCEIILIENYSASTKDELFSREKYFIQTISCVNKYIPNRKIDEYKKDKNEEIKAKDRLRNTTAERKEYMNNRYEENKEQKKDNSKLRYATKKEEILNYQKQKLFVNVVVLLQEAI